MAKQILQLGMSDAFDDWLMEKIQLLRRGSVIASGIKKVEKVRLIVEGLVIDKTMNSEIFCDKKEDDEKP